MNPLAGVAETMGRLARTVQTVRGPVPRPPANRAERRARGQRQNGVTGAQLLAARRTGIVARHRGHAVCPYTLPALIGAWSEGYTGKRQESA